MKNSKIYLLTLVIFTFLISIYLVGCNQSTSNEPENINNGNISLNKKSETNPVAIEKRKMLLAKFLKEVKDAGIKVKAKWSKLKSNNKNKVNALPPAEQEAMDYANSITPSAYSYVQSAYGVDLHDYFSSEDPNIAIAGLVIANLETDAQNGIFYELENEPLYSVQTNNSSHIATVNSLSKVKKTNSKLLSCALDALGFPLGIIAGAAGSGLSTAGIIKVIGKVARNSLGVIAAAWAVLEFTSCMDWI